jgi:hypothetical protein
MAGQWNGCSHGFSVRLVVVSDNGIGCHVCAGQGLSKKGFRTGLHRARGETTKPIERSHVAIRDRLRGARGLKSVATGQRFLEGFEGLHALRRGYIKLRALVPCYQPTKASPHETTRAVMVAINTLGTHLKKAA